MDVKHRKIDIHFICGLGTDGVSAAKRGMGMKRKAIKFFILIGLLFWCSEAYAIDTDENEIILGLDDIPYLTKIYTRQELEMR